MIALFKQDPAAALDKTRQKLSNVEDNIASLRAKRAEVLLSSEDAGAVVTRAPMCLEAIGNRMSMCRLSPRRPHPCRGSAIPEEPRVGVCIINRYNFSCPS